MLIGAIGLGAERRGITWVGDYVGFIVGAAALLLYLHAYLLLTREEASRT